MSKSNIYEISEMTGFSPSTVSRALSGAGYCSEKTRGIIVNTAQSIGFRPSSAARTLKSKRTNRILFCIPDICNPFYFDMIKGANEVLDKYGFYAMLCYTKHSLAEELKFIDLLMEHYGDGMIFVSFHFNEKNIGAIRRCGYPVVITNRYETPNGYVQKASNSFDCVYVDHLKATFLATEHLLAQGHRAIALVVGSLTEQTSWERAEGYFQAFEKYGLPRSNENLYFGDYTQASGCEAGKCLLDSAKHYTGVVAANDLMSLGVMSACSERGVRIPDELAIASLDNTDFATAIHPQLTSVNMMQSAIGANAASMLMERILEGRDYSKLVRLEPSLVIRQSSVNAVSKRL